MNNSPADFKNEVLAYFESKPTYSHGNNLKGKILASINTHNKNSIEHLQKVFLKYKDWRNKTEELSRRLAKITAGRNASEEMGKQGTDEQKTTINELVEKLNKYKDYITKTNKQYLKYSSQSKFESSILEEFLALLFTPLIDPDKYFVGSVRAYSNLYFSPKNLKNFAETPSVKINEKDQDFAIYRQVKLRVEGSSWDIFVPVISMECKTYLDKTMLEGSIATAEKIKMGNPHCKFFIVTETYDVKYEVDPSYSRIDAIYVLRKQKRIKNCSSDVKPICPNVVFDLYNQVKSHLESPWQDIENNIENFGRVM